MDRLDCWLNGWLQRLIYWPTYPVVHFLQWTDWIVDWMIDFRDWLTDLLTPLYTSCNGQTGLLTGWLTSEIDLLTYLPCCALFVMDRLHGWLDGWLQRLTYWLTYPLVHFLQWINWMADLQVALLTYLHCCTLLTPQTLPAMARLDGWLTDWLADVHLDGWPADWLADLLTLLSTACKG